jgi:hypothetical protein
MITKEIMLHSARLDPTIQYRLSLDFARRTVGLTFGHDFQQPQQPFVTPATTFTPQRLQIRQLFVQSCTFFSNIRPKI